MAIGTGKVCKNKPCESLKTSSPAKVYQSRASKPSAVEAISTIDAIDAATTMALCNELKAKMNELLEALKK